MTAAVMCENCRYFVHEPLNPAAGMGKCERGHGWWFPGQVHRCAEFRPEADKDDRTP